MKRFSSLLLLQFGIGLRQHHHGPLGGSGTLLSRKLMVRGKKTKRPHKDAAMYRSSTLGVQQLQAQPLDTEQQHQEPNAAPIALVQSVVQPQQSTPRYRSSTLGVQQQVHDLTPLKMQQRSDQQALHTLLQQLRTLKEEANSAERVQNSVLMPTTSETRAESQSQAEAQPAAARTQQLQQTQPQSQAEAQPAVARTQQLQQAEAQPAVARTQQLQQAQAQPAVARTQQLQQAQAQPAVARTQQLQQTQSQSQHSQTLRSHQAQVRASPRRMGALGGSHIESERTMSQLREQQQNSSGHHNSEPQVESGSAAAASIDDYRELIQKLLLYQEPALNKVLAAIRCERELLEEIRRKFEEDVEKVMKVREDIKGMMHAGKRDADIRLEQLLQHIASVKGIGSQKPSSEPQLMPSPTLPSASADPTL